MRSFDELGRLYAARPPLPRDQGAVEFLVRRVDSGKHETPEALEVSPEHGVIGDRWGKAPLPDPRAQVTLMMLPVAELVCDGQPLHWPGDNLLVSLDLDEAVLPIGARLRAGEALLEVSDKPHAGCKKFSARFGQDAMRWVNTKENLRRKLRGINCRVLEAGRIRKGDAIAIVPR